MIKDKLFWIYTYDQHPRDFPVIGVPNNPSQFYTLPQAATATGETCNTTTGQLTGAPSEALQRPAACTLAARQQMSYAQASYDWAAMLYGSSNISLSGYSGASGAILTDLGLQLGRRSGLALRISGDQYAEDRLADHSTGARERSLPPLAWDSPAACRQPPPKLTRGRAGQRLCQAGLRRRQAHKHDNQLYQQRIAFPVRPRARNETQQPYTAYTNAELHGSRRAIRRTSIAGGTKAALTMGSTLEV